MRLWVRVFQRLLYALGRHRGTLAAVIVVAVAGAAYFAWSGPLAARSVAAGSAPVEVSVQDIQPRGTGAALTLKEKQGNRRIAMEVNGMEALAIASQLGYRTQTEPPQAYDLLRETIQQMGGRIDRIVVNDASQSEYFAQIVVSEGDDVKVIKSRPADALALALSSKAPIFVEARVLDQFGSGSRGG